MSYKEFQDHYKEDKIKHLILSEYKGKLLIMSKLRKVMIHIDYLMGNNRLQSTLNKE